ncbi:transposase [soil metagenome]
MAKFQNKYNSESIRLKNWDYSTEAFYIVTICSDLKKHFFGNISKNGDSEKAVLIKSIIGEISEKYWYEIPNYYSYAVLVEFVIMPNHLHGIIFLDKKGERSNSTNKFGPQKENLGAIIRGYKASVKRFANSNKINFDWQSGYFDRIIRNENELNNFRQYIIDNPDNWISDKNYSED